jgi:hypothetical protein
VAFAKVLCDLKTGGGDGSVIDGKLGTSGREVADEPMLLSAMMRLLLNKV